MILQTITFNQQFPFSEWGKSYLNLTSLELCFGIYLLCTTSSSYVVLSFTKAYQLNCQTHFMGQRFYAGGRQDTNSTISYLILIKLKTLQMVIAFCWGLDLGWSAINQDVFLSNNLHLLKVIKGNSVFC